MQSLPDGHASVPAARARSPFVVGPRGAWQVFESLHGQYPARRRNVAREQGRPSWAGPPCGVGGNRHENIRPRHGKQFRQVYRMTVPPPTPDGPAVDPRAFDRLKTELMTIEDMSGTAAKRFIAKRGKQAAEKRIRAHWREWSG